MRIGKQCLTMAVLSIILLLPSSSVLAADIELSLEDSINLAMKNNYDIKYAMSAREKAYWSLKQAEGGKGLSIDFAHSDSRFDTAASDSAAVTSYNNQIALSVPVYSGGSLENKVEQAKLNLNIADLEIEAARQQLKLTVVNDYLTVLEYQNEVRVNQETVNNYQEHLNLVQAKYDIGVVAKTDVLSSQVDLAKAQDNLIVAQNNYYNAAAALNNAIGLPHGTQVALKDQFSYRKYPLTMEDCLQYAEIHRPEISQNAARISSAQYDVKIAESGKLPTVDLSVSEGWNDDHFPGVSNNNWMVKLTTSLNLFDTGVTKSKIKQAQHNVDMVKDQAGQEKDSILLSVRQYYLSMYEAEKRIDTNKVSVNQAEENLMIQKARYEVGVGTNLDLRDAVLALDSAQKDYIKALYDYNTSKAKLEQAMGLPVQ